jgi:hypothetical protein
MKTSEVRAELKRIADVATRQKDGGFTTESDAMMALTLIADLANLILQLEHGAKDE